MHASHDDLNDHNTDLFTLHNPVQFSIYFDKIGMEMLSNKCATLITIISIARGGGGQLPPPPQ